MRPGIENDSDKGVGHVLGQTPKPEGRSSRRGASEEVIGLAGGGSQ